jgi:transcriptional regulator with XRE-family HTH domain
LTLHGHKRTHGMHMAKTLGARIRKAREKAELSQPQLGRLLGKATATVYRWETDRTEPSLTTLRRVATVLHVQVTELIGGHAA